MWLHAGAFPGKLLYVAMVKNVCKRNQICGKLIFLKLFFFFFLLAITHGCTVAGTYQEKVQESFVMVCNH